jgi:hypothetical protein
MWTAVLKEERESDTILILIHVGCIDLDLPGLYGHIQCMVYRPFYHSVSLSHGSTRTPISSAYQRPQW